MEKEVTNQGIQAATRSWKGQRNEFSSWNLHRALPTRWLQFSETDFRLEASRTPPSLWEFVRAAIETNELCFTVYSLLNNTFQKNTKRNRLETNKWILSIRSSSYYLGELGEFTNLRGKLLNLSGALCTSSKGVIMSTVLEFFRKTESTGCIYTERGKDLV